VEVDGSHLPFCLIDESVGILLDPQMPLLTLVEIQHQIDSLVPVNAI
jgi:hypothetical protein